MTKNINVIGPSCCQHQRLDTPRTTAEINVRAGFNKRGGAGEQILLSSCPHNTSTLKGAPAQNKKRRHATILALRDDTIGIHAGREDAF